MKVLFVCEGITQSSIVAQPWKHVFEIAKRIMKQGNDVQILTDGAKNLQSEEEIGGVPVSRTEKGRFLFDSEKLLQRLNQEDADVVNWHGSDTWSALHYWRLRKRLKSNIVWTLHSGPLSKKDMRYLRFSELFLLYKFWNSVFSTLVPSFLIRRWTDVPQLKLVTALSERLKEHLQRDGIEEDKIKVVRSGVDTEQFSPSIPFSKDREKLRRGFQEEDLIIEYLGPLSTFRGVDALIAAMPEILKKHPCAKLVLLARGFSGNSEERKFQRLTESRKEIVLIPGTLEEKSLIQHMFMADIVVSPFRFWPQVECPLTLLEAMAMEKPIVTTDVGAISEIVRDQQTGILVSPTKRALAESVATLLSDKERCREIGKNAREYVKCFHDWNIISRQTLDVFESVLH